MDNEKQYNVALIDDDETVCFINRILLEKSGFNAKVKIHHNPLEALESLPDTETDLIFLDINMPELNGWDFLDSYHINDEKIIILTSSNSQDEIDMFKKQDKAVDILEKPLTIEKLQNVFSKHL